MKTCLAFLFAVLALPAPSALAQQRPPDLSFDSNPEFLKLPAEMNFGEVPGVAVNSKGHVFVFTRAPSGGGSGVHARRGAVVRVRAERRVRARDRPEPLRLG